MLIRNTPLVRQLETLAQCGICPNEGIGLETFLSTHPERAYERSPFKLLLEVLGDDTEVEVDGRLVRRPLSDNIWHFNAECIAGPGDYARIARRMATLAEAALPLCAISDEVDLRGHAALSFRLGEREFRWQAKVTENWVDPTIMTLFVALLSQQNTEQRFVYLDLAGRESLIGCATPAQRKMLRQRTGLDFEWLA